MRYLRPAVAPDGADRRQGTPRLRLVDISALLGDASLALDGESRADFAPGKPLLHRYAVKAAELGVGVSTIRRWTAAFRESGPAGLVADRPVRSVVERADHRWVEMAEVVLKAHARASRPVRGPARDPKRARGFADLPVTLPPAMRRISVRQNSLTALRSAVLVPGYATRRSAALDLGIYRTTFNGHLRMVEDAAGFAVFNHRKRPVRLTPRGQPLIREAKYLIALLDELCEPPSEE